MIFRMRTIRPLLHLKKARQHLIRCQLCSSSSPGAGEGAIDIDIPKAYNPKDFEETASKKWRNVAKRKKDGNKPQLTFRMLFPPPNVTGKLHLGHYLTLSVEDTIARWKLMTGLEVEWIPGFDHAGIATQSVVNRKMSNGSSLSTSDLKTNLQQFATSNQNSIKDQLTATGALLNWDKTYYTLDKTHTSAVREAFIQLFDSGLIKRADGMVNWCSSLQTTVADIEVDHIPFTTPITLSVPNHPDPVEFGKLYLVSYPLADQSGTLVVATSRPETMFGDVALAVNEEDYRFSKYIGQQVIHPLTSAHIPVIGDNRCKPDFGTGVLKITPAHDKVDFAVGATHHILGDTIFTTDGRLNNLCGEFEGLPRFVGRKKVLNFLASKGLIDGFVPYSGTVGVCSRSLDIIEPRLVPHWFLVTKHLSETLIQGIEDKSFTIAPENYARSLIHKLKEAQEWCLSRQIQWGHSIPAFYHKSHPDKWVAASDKQSAAKKLERLLQIEVSDEDIIQDKDVLDTWFSSAVIPLSVSGWPESDTVKEITLMETGHDILLFWVWRMVIMSLALTNRYPFRNVLLHGVVTDNLGRKMSKTKGNVIDPMHIIKGVTYAELVQQMESSYKSGELIETEYNLRKKALKDYFSDGFPPCGNDAVRLTLLSQNIFDHEVSLDLNYLDNCKRFSNKLWQALRFLKMHSAKSTDLVATEGTDISQATDEELVTKWILACLYEFNKTCESSLNLAKFHLYADAIRKFFYQDLCDIYIELIKGLIKTGDDITKPLLVMQYVFETGMKLAHPAMPFVTETIWSYLQSSEVPLLHQDFPCSKNLEQFADPQLIQLMSKGMLITKEIRAAKRRSGWGAKTTPPVYIEVDKGVEEELKLLHKYVGTLGGATITFGKVPSADKALYGHYLVDVGSCICRIHVSLLDATAVSPSQAKVDKLRMKLLKLQQQYDSPNFQQFAPVEAKEKLKKKVEKLIIQINEIVPNSYAPPPPPPTAL